jgi:hypothetical protein
MAATDLTPYATAKPFFGVLETWLPAEDAQRLAAYQLYESIYRNVPDAFKVIQRGSEQNPIYIPSGKTIIEAANRFLAKRWTYALDPKLGTPEERTVLAAFLQNMFAREEIYAKFATQKKYGLIRGDAVWHITADPAKEEGKRISVHEIDPGSYFPIYDPVNDEKVVGCHLVDQFDKGEGKGVVLRRQTYRRDPTTKRVTYEVSWWETGGWDDRNLEITSLPVYHVKNERSPGSPFGQSELAGLERVIGGINQAISDEEMSLALDGLGFYATTSGPPVNDDGDETDWEIGPGWVVEHDPESTWERVSGVSSTDPVQNHVAYLEKAMREASGTPDVAIGKVDSAIAESGISLALQFAPLLSKNEEKEQILLGKMDHILYDLTTMWLPAYEGMTSEARPVSIVDDPLPLNRKATIEEVVLLVTNNMMSVEYATQYLSEKLGFEFPETMLDDLVAEQTALAEARNADPFTARINRELQELEGNSA